MTYIVVTDNLIENLDNLDIDEFKYEKIKSNEFRSNTNVSLFSDDLYKFVTDEFFTFNNLQKINYDFNSKYIFQVKKSNLNKFQDIKSLQIIHNSKNNVEFFPWDLSNTIFDSRKKIDKNLLSFFTETESNFRMFLNFFSKEIFRLKLLISTDKKDVLEVLKEKEDYKYKKAQTILKKTSSDNIDDSIKYIYKIEKKLVESTYNQENSKISVQKFNSGTCISFCYFIKMYLKKNYGINSYIIPASVPSIFKVKGTPKMSHCAIVIPINLQEFYILDGALYFLEPMFCSLKDNKERVILSSNAHRHKNTFIHYSLKKCDKIMIDEKF